MCILPFNIGNPFCIDSPLFMSGSFKTSTAFSFVANCLHECVCCHILKSPWSFLRENGRPDCQRVIWASNRDFQRRKVSTFFTYFHTSRNPKKIAQKIVFVQPYTSRVARWSHPTFFAHFRRSSWRHKLLAFFPHCHQGRAQKRWEKKKKLFPTLHC